MALNISTHCFDKLTGKAVIVTGGSSGIGLAASQLFSRYGAFATIADLSPPVEAYLIAFETTIRERGKVDVLIANSGIGEIEELFLDTLDDAGKLKQPKHVVLDVNLKGVMDCVKVAIYHMRKQEQGGAIVMTASAAAYVSEKGLPVHSAAKHGLIGLMRALRPNLPKYRITINTVAPYMTESRLMTDQLRNVIEKYGIPVNKAESVAKAMAHLVSSGLNGKTIFCAADNFTEIEDSLINMTPKWLGEKNVEYIKSLEQIDLFSKESGI